MMSNRVPTTSRREAEDGVCKVEYVNPAAVAAARRALPSESDLRRTADCFQALANPARLRILKALQGRELCVCDVANLLGVSMSGASQQLRELRNLGAVDYRTAGKLAYYTLADEFWLGVAETVFRKNGVKPTGARRRATVRA